MTLADKIKQLQETKTNIANGMQPADALASPAMAERLETDLGTSVNGLQPEQASAEFWAFLQIHDVNADGTFTLAFPDLTPESPLNMSPEAIERVKRRVQERGALEAVNVFMARKRLAAAGTPLGITPEAEAWATAKGKELAARTCTDQDRNDAIAEGRKLFPGCTVIDGLIARAYFAERIPADGPGDDSDMQEERGRLAHPPETPTK